uniref:RPAP3_C domain-containing protein n=1 Tax=Globodera pallida TaxID=36090 RepID=A0A183CRN9_GLOPA
VENEVCDKLCEKCTYDGSVLVRAELAAAIQWFVIDFQTRFATICAELDRRVATQSPSSMVLIGNGTVHGGHELSELLLSDSASVAESTSTWSTHPKRKISARNGGGHHHLGGQQHRHQQHQQGGRLQGNSSNSIYAIIPRSASTIIPNPATIRRRFSPIRKMSAILSGPSTSAAPLPPVPPIDSMRLNSNSLFKFRVLSHIRSLESKTFIGPFERIWLCVLRLGLDPFDGVAKMGEQIIRYIFELSAKIKEARDKATNKFF